MRVSVLVNNHNHARWLPACLDSVLAQVPPADEIIVYDDASTDHSLVVLQPYVPRVTIIAGPPVDPKTPANIRQGHAIHQAFLRSTGDVLFLLDGDDLFTPGKIARYLTAFSQIPRPLLVQSPPHWIDANGQPLPRYAEPFKHTHDPLGAAYASHDPDLFYPTSSLAFHREFLSHALPLDWSDGIDLWSDTRLCLAALLQGPVTTLSEEYGGWRHHASSDSASRSRHSSYQLRQTLRRTKIFNQLARQSGHAPISLWKNRRFYRQIFRLIMPSAAFHLYQRFLMKTPATAPTVLVRN